MLTLHKQHALSGNGLDNQHLIPRRSRDFVTIMSRKGQEPTYWVLEALTEGKYGQSMIVTTNI